MNTWIVLLRGINVGGRNIVPMKELVDLFVKLDCANCRTYIQSGNVVLRSSEKSAATLKEKIEKAVALRFSLKPSVLLLSASELVSAVEANPFPEGTKAPTTLHFFFLANAAADYNEFLLQPMRAPKERFQLAGKVFYLLAPDGIGRSRLAANVEKKIGVAATARNYRTVAKLMQLVTELPGS